MSKLRLYISLFLMFVVLNISVNYHIYSENRENYLRDKLDTLSFQYHTISQGLKQKGDIYFDESVNTPTVISILEDLNGTNQNEIKERLIKALNQPFLRMREKGVRQFHFHTRDSNSLLRMHKKGRSGDSLKGIRYSVEATNLTLKSHHGFEEGRIYNGFRNVYPILHNGKHLGSVEISFSFQAVSRDLRETFRGNYTFIIAKSLVDSRVFNVSENYIDSRISDDFYSEKSYVKFRMAKNREEFTLSSHINQILYQSGEINKKLKENRDFSTLVDVDGDDYIVSFLSVKNIEGREGVAYIINYAKDNYISEEFKKFVLYTSIGSMVALIIIYFMMTHVRREEFAFINSLLENRSNLIFVKSNEKVIKVNNRLLEFFGFDSLDELQNSTRTICDFFIKEDGFLYKPEDSEENFLIERIREKPDGHFKVKMVDHSTKLIRIFSINIAHLKEQELYLAILSDITPNELEKKAIEDRASRDKLTGRYNRSKFDFDLKEHLTKHATFSLVLIDFDTFTSINEEYGHMAGDKILIEIADLIDKNIRKSDTIYRWGGDEFVIIVNDKMLSATKLAEKLRGLIENHRFYKEIPISASFGVTEHRKLESIDSLTERADKALYTAKLSGRNCVITC